jgi:hypothetical protein
VAWTGRLDRRTGELDAELLAAGLSPEQLSPPRDPTDPAPSGWWNYRVEPRPAHAEHYAARRRRFAEVYDALVRS